MSSCVLYFSPNPRVAGDHWKTAPLHVWQPLQLRPPQPTQTGPIQINEITCIFAGSTDLVWIQPKPDVFNRLNNSNVALYMQLFLIASVTNVKVLIVSFTEILEACQHTANTQDEVRITDLDDLSGQSRNLMLVFWMQHAAKHELKNKYMRHVTHQCPSPLPPCCCMSGKNRRNHD